MSEWLHTFGFRSLGGEYAIAIVTDKITLCLKYARYMYFLFQKLNRRNNGKNKNVLTLGWQEAPRSMWKYDGPALVDTGHFLPGNTTGQLNMPYWQRLLER